MKRRICVHCGREYVSDHPHSNVCSEKCRRERALQRNREYKRTHVLLVRCTICGKRIAGRGIYCDECKATHAKTADPALAYAPVSLNIIRRAESRTPAGGWSFRAGNSNANVRSTTTSCPTRTVLDD